MAVVLIAGGATGIGLAAMRRFRDRGDSVLLADINLPAAERAASEPYRGRATFFPCDLATPDGPSLAVAAAVAEYGALDIVFGNAGILISKPIEEITVEDWEVSMHVNVRAPFLLAQAAAVHLQKSELARMVFTASTAAFKGSRGGSAYCSSKAALVNLVRCLANELGPRGIRVNCVCPGWIDTPFNDPYWARQSDPLAARIDLENRIPLGAQGKPDDVAGLVLFLTSKESAYITGASFLVDGGHLVA